MESRSSFWSKQPGIFIKSIIAIWVSGVITTYIINEIFRMFPIVIWWFDNWCLFILQIYWFFVFLAVGLWPFNRIKGKYSRFIAVFVTCWILSFITYFTIVRLFDPTGSQWTFAMIGNLFFLIVTTGSFGENFGWSHLPPSRQFLATVTTNFALAWLIGMSPIRWIPAWWFSVVQVFLGTQLFGYLCRKMKQPMKCVVGWSLTLLCTAGYLWALSLVGWYDFTLPDPVAPEFWRIGNFTPLGKTFFNFWCAAIIGVLLPAHNWPFRKVKQPWGGILAGICTAIWSVAGTLFLWWLFPMIFPPSIYGPERWVYEVQCYAWLPTLYALEYPFGLWATHADYLWKGQKTPASWEDID